MTAPVNSTPLSIDYSSRDYAALRSDLIARMQTRLPDWTGNDPSDFGLALVEAFAYLGDSLNYYIDRIANENFIGTATQRQSIINLARMYGYTPSGYRSAYVTLQLTNSGEDDLTVHSGTQLSTDVSINDVVKQLIFTTAADVTVLSGDTAEVVAFHGEDVSTRAENFDADKSGELLGHSLGLPDQQFTLEENQVVDGSVEIWINSGSGYEQWTEIQHIVDALPNDKVFYLTTDAANYVCVNFGDSVSGLIPPTNAVIRAVYNVGGGLIGNVVNGTPFDFYQFFGYDYSNKNLLISSLSTVASTAGTGGLDPESNDSIRVNAPRSLTAFNRAVTLKDFSSVALAVPGVGKTNADAQIWSSVNVYVAPQQNSDSSDLYPGYGDTPNIEGNLTVTYLAIQENVQNYLADKAQIGVSVSVLPPTYTNINLVLQYKKKSGYSEDRVTASIRSAVASAYSYTNMLFAQIISPEEVEANLRLVDGVDTIKVQYMYRDELDATPTRDLLVGAPGEIFSFQDGNTSVVLLSDDASLSGLVSSTGALSPVFNSDFYNYNVTSSTTSITLTPTVTSGASVYMNGVLVTSGSAHTVSTPSGQTPVLVSVIAADGITSRSYRVTITR